MQTKPTSSEPPLAAYETAIAEERQLWQVISDPRSPATDRVKAYARWLQTVNLLKKLGAPVDRKAAPGGPT